MFCGLRLLLLIIFVHCCPPPNPYLFNKGGLSTGGVCGLSEMGQTQILGQLQQPGFRSTECNAEGFSARPTSQTALELIPTSAQRVVVSSFPLPCPTSQIIAQLVDTLAQLVRQLPVLLGKVAANEFSIFVLGSSSYC